jgi:FkbM family methyltransferase
MSRFTALRRLRPAKVAGGLRRRWFEFRLERMKPRRSVPGLEALGTSYGSWLVPTTKIEDGWICYCIGTGADISFELELLKRWRVQVRSFDAVLHFVEHLRETIGQRPGLTIDQAALALRDGPLRMQVSHVAASRSVSAAGLYESDLYEEAPGRTLPSLMAQYLDQHVDLLKIDVEGLEYELVPTLDLEGLGVKVLCIQLHHPAGIRGAKELVATLETRGYEFVGTCPTVKHTFVHRSLLDGAGPP